MALTSKDFFIDQPVDKVGTNPERRSDSAVLQVKPKLKAANEKEAITFKGIFRPIQYLGSKYRALPLILTKINELVESDTYVLDLFSGSSVVSQAININGIPVVANDSLRFNMAFSEALLNVGRKPDDVIHLKDLIGKVLKYRFTSDIEDAYASLIHREQELLNNRNTSAAIKFYEELPQVWKKTNETTGILVDFAKEIDKKIGESAFDQIPLIASYYAGTYFGLQQALTLDRIRCGIEFLKINNQINEWQYAILLTSLLNTSSKIVYSAGKHFAQPVKSINILKSTITFKRFYEDRTKDVANEYLKSFSQVLSCVKETNNCNRNLAMGMMMEEITDNKSILPKISIIYADPPYTAQQYSRFYHVPEIIYTYCYPKLQLVDGKTTSGLYPTDRQKSRFCSKREALNAFDDLFKLAGKLGSHVILSYSSSLTGATGNDRMISLAQILESGKRNLPNAEVDIIKFDFVYRQLNKTSKIVAKKEDKEFLIVFKRKE